MVCFFGGEKEKVWKLKKKYLENELNPFLSLTHPQNHHGNAPTLSYLFIEFI